jgi:hypothetical protein
MVFSFIQESAMHAVPAHFHRAPDPVPVDDPVQLPFDNPHPHHQPLGLPDDDDDPLPDPNPMLAQPVLLH